MITETIQEQNELKECRACKLCRDRIRNRTRVIFGAGPVPASIVAIGMGGGAEEAATGRPFVGPAGRKLNQMLTDAGIDPLLVFKTNILLCRPTNNRAPEQDELDACRPFVTRELTRVAPKVIVAAGAEALKYFKGKASITSCVGEAFWHEEYKCHIMPIFHPAYLLRRQNQADDTRNIDALKKAAILAGLAEAPAPSTIKEHTKVRIIKNVEEARSFFEFLNKQPEVAFDFETNSLNVHSLTPLSIGFSWAEGKAVVLPLAGYKASSIWMEHEYDEIVSLLDKWADNSSLKIAANIQFDALCFKRMGITLRQPWYDVEAAHHLIDENAAHDLDSLSWLVGMGGYKRPVYDRMTIIKDAGAKEARKKKEKFSRKSVGYDELPTEVLWPYNGNDADCTFRLKQLLDPQLKDTGAYPLAKNLIMPLHQVFSEMKWNGVAVNREYLLELKERYAKRMEELNSTILKHPAIKQSVALLEKRALGKLREKNDQKKAKVQSTDKKTGARVAKEIKAPSIPFNIGSAPHLRVLLFDVLKLRSDKKTKKGNAASTDKEVLASLTEKHELPALIDEHRKLKKLSSTYIEGLLESSKYDSRAHTSYNINGTVTGRLCVAPDTLLETDQGVFEISKLPLTESKKYKILSHKGRWCSILQKISKGEEEMFRVSFSGGGHLECTLAHRILTSKGWKDLSELRVGDKVISNSSDHNESSILSIKPVGIKEVWDIEVAGDHSYLAGGVFNHNSSSGPNLQNIPGDLSGRKEEIRNIFISKPGYVLIEADYSQAEFRHWANCSQDAAMLEDIKRGMDVHVVNASLVYNVPVEQVTKAMRSTAKALTFGVMYGRGAWSIAKQYGLLPEEAERVQQAILTKYFDGNRWLKNSVALARQRGYVQTVFGRRRHLPGIKSDKEFEQAEAERQAVNSPIQGGSGDMTNLAVVRIYKEIHGGKLDPKAPKVWDADIVLQVHDSIACEVREDQAEAFIKEVAIPCMTRPMPNINVPMAVEAKIGKSWGLLKDYEVS